MFDPRTRWNSRRFALDVVLAASSLALASTATALHWWATDARLRIVRTALLFVAGFAGLGTHVVAAAIGADVDNDNARELLFVLPSVALALTVAVRYLVGAGVADTREYAYDHHVAVSLVLVAGAFCVTAVRRVPHVAFAAAMVVVMASAWSFDLAMWWRVATVWTAHVGMAWIDADVRLFDWAALPMLNSALERREQERLIVSIVFEHVAKLGWVLYASPGFVAIFLPTLLVIDRLSVTRIPRPDPPTASEPRTATPPRAATPEPVYEEDDADFV